jgi:hypothetical protein
MPGSGSTAFTGWRRPVNSAAPQASAVIFLLIVLVSMAVL